MLVGTVEATVLILLVVVVFGPIVAERLRIPGIVGLIFGGMVFGPFVIGWLEAGGLVDDLGAIGILYLMFLAGLSFDIKAFVENRNTAIVYGLLGFVLPFMLAAFVMQRADSVEVLGAFLIGAMWASNTLVAYPEVQTAGLQGNRAVSAAVSAGVVADLLSLTVLALATATAVIEIEPFDLPFGGPLADYLSPDGVEPTTPDPTMPLWIGLPLLGVVCLWLIPRITDWFFVKVGRSRVQRFVFSLAGMAAGATIALLGGMEGLIGAFLAGLGMNRLVPSQGPLMQRLDFVGTSVFVPAFLVSIGLNIDPALLVDPETLGLGVLFTGFVVVGKGAAAIITGLIFKLSHTEIGLMSSLSFGQAASTLAIAQVGLSLGMFDQMVVNASVLAIVFTALLTSYGTRFFAQRVTRPTVERQPIGTNVMLDVRDHGSDLASTIAFAAGLAGPDYGLVVPYGVTEVEARSVTGIVVERAVAAASAQGLDVQGVVRVDDSFSDGTLNLVEEQGASLVILSWAGPRFASDYVFGNDIDGVGARSPVPTMAARVLRPWTRIVVSLGHTGSDAREEDAKLALAAARRLRQTGSLPVTILALDESLSAAFGSDDDVDVVIDPEARRSMLDRIEPDDLVLAPAHLLQDLSPLTAWRNARALDDHNIAIVAGPHRLSTSKGVARQSGTAIRLGSVS